MQRAVQATSRTIGERVDPIKVQCELCTAFVQICSDEGFTLKMSALYIFGTSNFYQKGSAASSLKI